MRKIINSEFISEMDKENTILIEFKYTEKYKVKKDHYKTYWFRTPMINKDCTYIRKIFLTKGGLVMSYRQDNQSQQLDEITDMTYFSDGGVTSGHLYDRLTEQINSILSLHSNVEKGFMPNYNDEKYDIVTFTVDETKITEILNKAKEQKEKNEKSV